MIGHRSPAFWWTPNSLFGAFLAPLGAVFGQVSAARIARPPLYRSPLPVICIGNFVVGGAGKTPLALAVADLLESAGRRPGFLSRGYGGSLAGPVRVDVTRHNAGDVGDEPLLLAEQAPTLVARDRVAGAGVLEQQGVDCFILDDGFQNPALAKTVSVVVVDATVGIGNGRCMPAGPLRAPIADQLQRADAVVLLGAGTAGDRVQAVCEGAGVPVFRARLEIAPPPELADRPLLAWCGIGRPQKFYDSLREAGLTVSDEVPLSDHEPVSDKTAADILARCERAGLTPVTTTKDAARIRHTTTENAIRLRETSVVIPARCVFDEIGTFSDFLVDSLNRRGVE